MKIALDAAKGLAFLHNADPKVIYRDFKTSNILLDSVQNYKIPNLVNMISKCKFNELIF